MEDPANRRNSVLTSQNSSLSSLDYSDLTLSLPALPTSEAGDREDKGSALFESSSPTSQDQRYGREVEDLSQWQCEFRGQITALRQWLKSMEMRLLPLDPRGKCGSRKLQTAKTASNTGLDIESLVLDFGAM
ncbi:hypothetical protein CgunFtcFv8_019955 [Champsocephalus gunnari]|uniref:Uncharacterized protein n=1 Tax=Champsocephalus gunnari TaxID=52237 RepID=A0AAN8DIV9_CHAGU|nr:hypothetical protein CgunFtcFv8_019955 [Champsocephalus gunnari]